MFVQAANISFCKKIETGTWVPRILTALPEPCYPGLEMFGDSWAVSPLESEVSKPQAIVWLLQLRDGLEIPGKTELPEDKRRGKQKPIVLHVQRCLGVPVQERGHST